MKWKACLLASTLLLASCSNDAVQEPQVIEEKETLAFNLGNSEKMDGILEYDVINIAATEQISPPNPASIKTVMEVENSDSRFLDVTVHMKNLYSAEKTSGELMKLSYEIGGQEYQTFQKKEVDNASMLKDGEFSSLEPLTSAVIHYIAEVPKFDSKETIEIIAEIDGKTYTSTTSLEENNANKEFISIGETIEMEQYANLTLENMYYTDKVASPNPGTFSSYYEPENQSNTFLVLEMKVKNLKATELQADSIFASKVIYDQYYEFDGFPTLLAADGSDLHPASIMTIPSLNENTLLYLLEVPKELKETKGIVSVWFADHYYHIAADDRISTKQANSNNTLDSTDKTTNKENVSAPDTEVSQSDVAQSDTIRKGSTDMSEQETLDLISHNEGIDFSTHSYEMSFDEKNYLIIEVGQGEMAVATYKIDGDGVLLQFDPAAGVYLPAEQVTDGGS